MLKRRLLSFLLPFALLVLPYSSALALPIIDFTDSSFSVVHDQTGVMVENVLGDLDITFQSTSKMTWNPGLDGGVDGIGIIDDEITNPEVLTLLFSEDIYLSAIYLTDLFYEGNPEYQEEGYFQLLVDQSWTPQDSFMAPIDNISYPATNGEFYIALDTSINVGGIRFGAPLETINDYSVRGIDVAPVPEPATMLLLGTGLIGMAGLGRKRLKNK